MEIGENGIIYDRNESLDISNKGEKMLKNYRAKGKCMYNGCNNNSIDSHTISEKISLSTISVNGEVGCFASKRDRLEKEIIYDKVHVNNISTFKGFCSKHDNNLFKSIDNNSEIKDGNEILLQSYRSVCKSLFDEGCYPSLELSEKLDIDMIKKYFSYDEVLRDLNLDDSKIMSIFDSVYSEHKEKLLESRRVLSNYKESIENDIKSNFSKIIIEEINGTRMKLVTTADKKVSILYNWFDWRIPVSIFNHHFFKTEKSVDCILNFTYIPYENSAEVFWIFLNRDYHFFYKYWEWFISKNINTLNTIESCMMALENWCINPQIINDLPEERKKVFLKDMYFNTERTNIMVEYDISIFDDIRKQLIKSRKCDVKKEITKFSVPFRESDEIRKEEYGKIVFNMF